MQDFHDRVAFITGGASGIGLGIAKRLVDAGCKAAIADLRQDHLDEAITWFEEGQLGSRVYGVQVDVTNRARMAEAADEVEREFGPVTILVNNAGVGVEGPLSEASYADWDFGLGVNLGGVVNGIQTFVPRMRSHGRGGHVVNTASLAGMVSMPSWMAIYATAKAAVIAMSEAIADDLARDGIGVSVLCPGPIKSRIHELSRNRPEGYQPSAAFAAAADRLGERKVSDLWMEPEQVGDMVVDAIRNDKLYIITHGEWRDAVQQRHDRILAAMPTEVNDALIASLRPVQQERTEPSTA
jgi:NAD(P)-dependent dehydrogenase (short-subunit alcohol dehydrogenase family)